MKGIPENWAEGFRCGHTIETAADRSEAASRQQPLVNEQKQLARARPAFRDCRTPQMLQNLRAEFEVLLPWSRRRDQGGSEGWKAEPTGSPVCALQ
jgi:hypothetical protein